MFSTTNPTAVLHNPHHHLSRIDSVYLSKESITTLSAFEVAKVEAASAAKNRDSNEHRLRRFQNEIKSNVDQKMKEKKMHVIEREKTVKEKMNLAIDSLYSQV